MSETSLPATSEFAERIHADETLNFDACEKVAVVEIDRFCRHCGYNLRTRPVRRDPHTDILLTRCPECGRFTAATDSFTTTRAWLKYVVAFLIVTWILTLISLAVGAAFSQGGMTVVTAEQLWRLDYYRTEDSEWYPHRLEEFRLFTGFFVAIQLLCSFIQIQIAAVSFPHWKKRFYFLLAVVLPLFPAIVVWTVFHYDQPDRFITSSGPMIITSFTALAIVGGVIGAIICRRLARLTIRIFIPPRWRGPMAYLWLTDGLEPPIRKDPDSKTTTASV